MEYQSYSIDKLSDANVNGCHRFEVFLRRQDGSQVLHDYTGANSILFAFKCTRCNLTEPEKRELTDMIATFLVEARVRNGP